ncbi:hypothetical protein KIK02_18200 [Leptodesmis sichuanensis A121]|nr:hypothetical protein [Leptodesmis sichuanensis]UIE36917.1 hypothetical protein KIK02_18200 [Leptodesmis sichuanensis A121]
MWQVLNRFTAPSVRLITLSTVNGKAVAEVTHEALFIHWQLLKDWLSSQRDLIRQQRKVE